MTNILIIDDSPQMGHMLTELVRLLGYKSQFAQGGVAGVAAVQEQIPDLVLLDIMMPELNGWQVQERVRCFSSVPIIFVSTDNSAVSRIQAAQVGCRLLPKNVTPAVLKKNIEEHLRVS